MTGSTSTSDTAGTRRLRIPGAVYLLGLSLFAMGTSEFLLAGVLPAVAADLGVSLSSAGFLVTAFAIGVVLGGPPFAIVSRNWPPRSAIVSSLLIFASFLGLGLLGGYWSLLLSRFAAGVAYSGFFAVATVAAVRMTHPNLAGRASSVVVSGLSLAMIAGGPLGTALSQATTWRVGFAVVVALTASAALVCWVTLRPTTWEAPSSGSGTSAELNTLRRPRLWTLWAFTALSTASYMLTFNYLAAMLEDVTQATDWVPATLALFGVGAFLGLNIDGRFADALSGRLLILGTLAIGILSFLLVPALHTVWATLPVILLLGVASFVINPAIFAQLFRLGPEAPMLAGSITVSAFQLGISATPALAAAVLATGLPIVTICLLGGFVALACIPLRALDHRLRGTD